MPLEKNYLNRKYHIGHILTNLFFSNSDYVKLVSCQSGEEEKRPFTSTKASFAPPIILAI